MNFEVAESSLHKLQVRVVPREPVNDSMLDTTRDQNTQVKLQSLELLRIVLDYGRRIYLFWLFNMELLHGLDISTLSNSLFLLKYLLVDGIEVEICFSDLWDRKDIFIS